MEHLVKLSEGKPGVLELFSGDLSVPNSYDSAFDGADGIVHAAASVQVCYTWILTSSMRSTRKRVFKLKALCARPETLYVTIGTAHYRVVVRYDCVFTFFAVYVTCG